MERLVIRGESACRIEKKKRVLGSGTAINFTELLTRSLENITAILHMNSQSSDCPLSRHIGSRRGVIFIGVSHTVGLIRLGQPTLKI